MSNKYSEKEVERLLALRAKATGGPWIVAHNPVWTNAIWAGDDHIAEFAKESDTMFAVASHALADQLTAAREIVKGQKREIAKWHGRALEELIDFLEEDPRHFIDLEPELERLKKALRLTEESSDEKA